MNKKVIILIIMACLLASCSVLSKVGESIGIVKEKEVPEKVESTKKISTKINTEKENRCREFSNMDDCAGSNSSLR